MNLNQAKTALRDKLIKRGMSPERASIEADKFVQDQTDTGYVNDKIYPNKWLDWKVERIIDGLQGLK